MGVVYEKVKFVWDDASLSADAMLLDIVHIDAWGRHFTGWDTKMIM